MSAGSHLTVRRLNIANESSLARALGIRIEELLETADASSDHYKPFLSTPRPRPFSRRAPKKPRPIDNPIGKLKRVQDQIYKALLRPTLLPDHIFGGVKHRSIVGNAQCHQGADLLVTVDVKQCFPSITNVQVHQVWLGTLGCSPGIADILTRLTTFGRHLPQGAPTSPALANIFIWSIDQGIREECASAGVEYSTWIDDLAFSGEKARDMIQVAVDVLKRHNLKLSRKKIKIMGTRQSKNLTGTRLGNCIVRAPRELCDRARAAIHKLECNLIDAKERERYVNSVRALIQHIRSICPKDAKRLAEKLSAQS